MRQIAHGACNYPWFLQCQADKTDPPGWDTNLSQVSSQQDAGIHLPILEGWKADLAKKEKKVVQIFKSRRSWGSNWEPCGQILLNSPPMPTLLFCKSNSFSFVNVVPKPKDENSEASLANTVGAFYHKSSGKHCKLVQFKSSADSENHLPITNLLRNNFAFNWRSSLKKALLLQKTNIQ